MATAPAAISRTDRPRIRVMCSFRMKTENIVPNRMDVSRSAATSATGDYVMAHSAIPYEANVQPPPRTLFFQSLAIR